MPRKKAIPPLSTRVLRETLGSCTCGQATGIILDHDPFCHHRLLFEAVTMVMLCERFNDACPGWAQEIEQLIRAGQKVEGATTGTRQRGSPRPPSKETGPFIVPPSRGEQA